MKNIILIGCGYWGKNWYNTIKSSQYNLVAVVDPSPVIKIDVPLFKSLEDVTIPYDYAIIATNAELHYSLKQKVKCSNILVEKPCGIDTTRHHLMDCFPGYIFLSSPQFKWIKNNIHTIGKIFYSNFHRASMGPRIRTDVSIIEDYAIHDLYIYQALFGGNEISSINVNLLKNFKDPVQEDSLFLTVVGGHTSRFFSSWVYPNKKRTIEIVGELGSIVWENDKIIVNYSRYNKIDGVDSYRNVGYELIEASSNVIEFPESASNLHLQLDDFVNGESRSEILKNTDSFIKKIKASLD